MASNCNSEIIVPITIDKSILFCDDDSEHSSYIRNNTVSNSASLSNRAAGNTKEQEVVESYQVYIEDTDIR